MIHFDGITLYLLTALLWGTHASQRQLVVENTLWKLIVGFLFNFIFWPISMVIAIIRFDHNISLNMGMEFNKNGSCKDGYSDICKSKLDDWQKELSDDK